MLLDGLWDFHFGNRATLQDALPPVSYDELSSVPGCFDVMPSHAGKRGCGFYRKRVTCGNVCRLEIGGLGLEGKVFFDGRLIGTVSEAFANTVFRFDAGERKEHELVIAVSNMFDGKKESQFREYYDFYAYGGIYRSVKLSEIDPDDVVSCRISTLDHVSRKISIAVETESEIPANTEFLIDGKAAGHFAFQGTKAYAELTLPGAGLWSPENPVLHEFVFGKCSVVFGIRTIKAEKGKLFLNGKELFLRGICRHDSHPEFGYALPETLLLNDLQSIRRQGFNCIRGSHYPQSETMLSICDRLGLLVWDETLGWQNRIESLTDPEFERRQLSQLENMVRVSANHPSVILWGFLNECFSDTEDARPIFRKIVDAFHKADPTRPVTFATMFQEKDRCCDICDVLSFNVYPGWYAVEDDDLMEQEFRESSVEKVFAKLRRFTEKWPEKPMLISEIGAEARAGDHSGLRWSEEYQETLLHAAFRNAVKDPRYSGIFFWLYCDVRSYSNCKAQERAGGFNSKGMVDQYRRPKRSWLGIRDFLQGFKR